MELGERMGESVGRHRLGHGGNDEQVAAFGHFLEIGYRRVRLGVHDDMLKMAVSGGDGGLLFVHDLEWQAVASAALAPFDGSADGVAIDKQGRGKPLKESGEVQGSRRLADSTFIAGYGDDHSVPPVYAPMCLCAYSNMHTDA